MVEFHIMNNTDEERDPLLAEACRFVIERQNASIGVLQRKFAIGFNRAARLVDQMEELGLVGPICGSKPRQILMSKDECQLIISPAVTITVSSPDGDVERAVIEWLKLRTDDIKELVLIVKRSRRED